MNCDICGERLTKRQMEISNQINGGVMICDCPAIKRIDKLEKKVKKLKEENKRLEISLADAQ